MEAGACGDPPSTTAADKPSRLDLQMRGRLGLCVGCVCATTRRGPAHMSVPKSVVHPGRPAGERVLPIFPAAFTISPPDEPIATVWSIWLNSSARRDAIRHIALAPLKIVNDSKRCSQPDQRRFTKSTVPASRSVRMAATRPEPAPENVRCNSLAD
jgi:hypothetical protein